MNKIIKMQKKWKRTIFMIGLTDSILLDIRLSSLAVADKLNVW